MLTIENTYGYLFLSIYIRLCVYILLELGVDSFWKSVELDPNTITLDDVFEKTALISRMSLCKVQMSHNYIEEDIKR